TTPSESASGGLASGKRADGLLPKIRNSPGASRMGAATSTTVYLRLSLKNSYQTPLSWKAGTRACSTTPKLATMVTWEMASPVAEGSVRWMVFKPEAPRTSKVKSEVSKIGSPVASRFNFDQVS